MVKLVTEISTADTQKLRRLVTIANLVLSKGHEGKRAGCSFHVRNEHAHVLFAERFGQADEDDACRHDFFASEKTMRLCFHPEHTLSWQSHNTDTKQYPGGVRFLTGVIAALSGYTAEEDEAAVLWIGVQMGWITLPGANAASHISDNPRYVELFQKFTQAELSTP